jgi:hypothetical protein
MKSGNSGGRPDNWTVIGDGAGMTVSELKATPPVIGQTPKTADSGANKTPTKEKR